MGTQPSFPEGGREEAPCREQHGSDDPENSGAWEAGLDDLLPAPLIPAFHHPLVSQEAAGDSAGKLSLRPSLGPDLGPGKPGGAREDAAGVEKGVTGLARSPLLTAPERP